MNTNSIYITIKILRVDNKYSILIRNSFILSFSKQTKNFIIYDLSFPNNWLNVLEFIELIITHFVLTSILIKIIFMKKIFPSNT